MSCLSALTDRIRLSHLRKLDQEYVHHQLNVGISDQVCFVYCYLRLLLQFQLIKYTYIICHVHNLLTSIVVLLYSMFM